MRRLLFSLMSCMACMTAQSYLHRGGPGFLSSNKPPKTGLVRWYKPESLGSDGSAISTWSDSSGLASHATQNTATYKPTVIANAVDGFSAARFGATSLNYMTVSLSPLKANSASICAVMKPAAVNVAQQSYWMTSYTPLQTLNHNGGSSSSQAYWQYYDGSGKGGPKALPAWQQVCYLSGSDVAWAINGRVYTPSSAATGTNSLLSNSQMGAYTGSYYLNGYIAEVLIYDHRLTAQELAVLTHYLGTKYPSARETDTAVHDGDSLTSGSYPIQVMMNEGFKYVMTNLGIVGQSLQTMLANEPAKILPLCKRKVEPGTGNKYRRILFIWGGTNDIDAAVIPGMPSPATTYANYVAYGNAARAAGCKVVVFTVLPRSSSNPNFEADRATFNASVRAGWPSFADALADVAADPNIGCTGCNMNATYYTADHIHMMDAGYAVVANLAKAALDVIW